MKNIVVTTDLSPEAQAAFNVAQKLANAFHSHVRLLTVVEDPQQAAMVYAMEFPVFPDSNIQRQLLEKVQVELHKIAADYFPAISTDCSVREAKGPVFREIIDFATETHADMIVMATHGRTGVKHLLIGSIAERVAREACCPVVVVPTKRAS